MASVLFLLAIGSKTVAVTAPPAPLVVLWWKQGQLVWRRDALPLIPWFVAAGAAGGFVAWFERNWIGAGGAGFDFTLLERVLLAGRIFWFYLGKVFWPADLMFYYPRWNVSTDAPAWFGWVIALVAATVLLWAMRQRARGPLARWLEYAGGLAPFLFGGIVPLSRRPRRAHPDAAVTSP